MRPLRTEEVPFDPVAVERARIAFLECGRILPGVRPEIVHSWQRARSGRFLSCKVPWKQVQVPADSALIRAFDGELASRLTTLSKLGVSVMLVNRDAVVTRRYGIPDGQENVHLVRMDALPSLGVTLEESAIGTHAANLALDSGSSARVTGHEHLHERYLNTQSLAIPIAGPKSERILGALVVETIAAAPSSLLEAWAGEVAVAVRTRLLRDSNEREQLLLRDFLRARSETRDPVVCLDEQTVICTATASRVLGADNQALLWEYASQSLHAETQATRSIALQRGGFDARFKPVVGPEGPIGMRITLRKTRASNAVQPGSELQALLPGSSRSWVRMVHELEAALYRSRSVVLVGEPGTGKRHLARTVFPDACEVDCAAEVQMVDTLATHATCAQPLILAHTERLSRSALEEVKRILRSESFSLAPVVLTLNETHARSLEPSQLESGLGPHVCVPSLRDRLDDLPLIVRQLTARLPDDQVRWMPDALQSLSRVSWPENVRSLQLVVDAAVLRCCGGYVDSHSLPEGIRVQAAGRHLSRLEQLEANELLSVLRDSSGDKKEAARRLGIARSTLYRRIRALRIDLASVNF